LVASVGNFYFVSKMFGQTAGISFPTLKQGTNWYKSISGKWWFFSLIARLLSAANIFRLFSVKSF
jgi:hypothetical protein